jgi:hypothetical protein
MGDPGFQHWWPEKNQAGILRYLLEEEIDNVNSF